MGANITKVYLMNVPLENDYKHTLMFKTLAEQQSYFSGRAAAGKQYTDFSYQRKDNVIRVPEQYDTVLKYNYVMYQNAAYSNKWFYAFITDITYVNDDRTDLKIETDVLQTWMFDYEVKTSFFERMHVLDDTIGAHTVPEQLETGEYVVNNTNRSMPLRGYVYILACTLDLNGDLKDNKYKGIGGAVYNGIYSGLKYYSCSSLQLNAIIEDLADKGQSDGIVTIFIAPSMYVLNTSVPEGGKYPEITAKNDVTFHTWTDTTDISAVRNPIMKPTTIDGYTPKNNKLFTYPYCYLLLSNNNGGAAVYHYEKFKYPTDNNECPFTIFGTITPGMSIRAVPGYYNGVTGTNGGSNNHEEGLNAGKFPICNWNTDVYTNWLTQNSVNIGISLGTAAMQVAGGLALSGTGAGALMGAGTVGSGLLSIASTMGEIYSHSLQPPQAEGNLNSGDVSFSMGNNNFVAYQMTIKREYARMIDDYFTMYGYKVNYVGKPVHFLRENFWYFKTIDANIDGAIPGSDLQKIKDCWNNGITFWSNPANIGNYLVSNNITEN